MKEKRKFSYKEQREGETISQDIEKAEQVIEQSEGKRQTACVDFTLLQDITNQLADANAKYEKLIERWSYLEEIASS
mgnify:CR=1 FL=1